MEKGSSNKSMKDSSEKKEKKEGEENEVKKPDMFYPPRTSPPQKEEE